jgi:DNA-binding FadR family transcriptional regulator
MAVEVGVAVLAAERADTDELDALADLVSALDGMLEDFPAYRQADVRVHIGLAQTTKSPRLTAAMTEVQGEMTGLIALIAHPPAVLASSNDQHRRVLKAIRAGDEARAAREMAEHLRGTEHVLAGLLPRA